MRLRSLAFVLYVLDGHPHQPRLLHVRFQRQFGATRCCSEACPLQVLLCLNQGFAEGVSEPPRFLRRRHDRLYLHGPHPRKTTVLNHGLHPLRTMVLKIPALAPGYRKEHRSGCRGGFHEMTHGSERVQTMVSRGWGPCKYRQSCLL